SLQSARNCETAIWRLPQRLRFREGEWLVPSGVHSMLPEASSTSAISRCLALAESATTLLCSNPAMTLGSLVSSVLVVEDVPLDAGAWDTTGSACTPLTGMGGGIAPSSKFEPGIGPLAAVIWASPVPKLCTRIERGRLVSPVRWNRST